MNACALEFGDASFDAVLDKGTMDSILCGEGSINNVANLCMEVSRCVAVHCGVCGSCYL
jgi:EEF1A lysine methyltransferase 4